jgi:hypothetical protein
MSSGSILSELNRIPPEMRAMQNRLAMQQQLLRGDIEFVEEKEDLVPKQDIIADKHKQPVRPIPEKVTAPVIQTVPAEPIPSLNLKELSDSIASKVINALHEAKSADQSYLENNTTFEAILKIDVLSYTFKFIKIQVTPLLIILVIKDDFSLDIKDPVNFKLSTNDINSFTDLNVVCLGAPIKLEDMGISLLLFAKDN